MAKPIKNLKFTRDDYPDVLRVINKLSQLEGRRPHDTANRLIVRFGKERIAELNEDCSQAQSAIG